MNGVPKQFSLWVTKQVSVFCVTSQMRPHIDDTIVKKCPNCRCLRETTAHIPLYHESGHQKLFHLSIDRLVEWHHQHQTLGSLISLLHNYLWGQGAWTLSYLLLVNSPYAPLATVHDELGWINFMEVRICFL